MELLQRAKHKGYSSDDALAVIDELSERGWQSDNRFAESFVRQRIAKGYGPIRIDYELRQRGIENTAPDDFFSDWESVIEDVYRKKYSSDNNLTRNEWAKRQRFLQQRGFGVDLIRELSRRLKIRLL